MQTPNWLTGVKFDTMFSVPLYLSILYIYTTYLHEKIFIIWRRCYSVDNVM